MPITPTLTLFYGVIGTQATSITDTAHLLGPLYLDIDADDSVYVSDKGAIAGSSTPIERILKITKDGFASTQATHTQVGGPSLNDFVVVGVDDLFVGGLDRRIYRVTGGSVGNITGTGVLGYLDGPGSTAKLGDAFCMAMVSGQLWFGDFNANRIRKVDGSGNVSTVAGSGSTSWANGTGTAANLGYVFPAAVSDASGNYWFTGGSSLVGYYLAKCTPGGVVTTQVDYTGIAAHNLFSLCRGPDNNIYAFYNGTGGDWRIDKIDVATNTRTTLYAFTTGTPRGMTCDSLGNLYLSFAGITGTANNFSICKIAGAVTPATPTTPWFTTFYGVIGTAATVITDIAHITNTASISLDVDSDGCVYMHETANLSGFIKSRVLKISPDGLNATTQATDTTVGTTLTDFSVIGPDDVFVGTNRQIFRMTGGAVGTVVGSGAAGYLDGASASAKIGDGTYGLAMVSGNLWWGDFSTPRIRKVDGAGNVSAIAGDGTSGWANGTGTAAKVGYVFPSAVADASGNYWFTGGSGANHYLAKCTPAGVVTTQVTYTGVATEFEGICLGPDNNIYVLYRYAGSGNKIDKIDVATNTPTTIYSWSDGSYARGITIDSAGNLYVVFTGATTGTPYNYTIQKIANAVTPVVPDTAPKITLQPISTSAFVGDSVTLRSAASGTPTPTVQWQSVAGAGPTTGLPSLNGVLGPWAVGTPGLIYPGDDGYPDPLATWANVSGATNPNLTVTPSAVGAKRYKAFYLNSSGGAITNSASITASAAPSGGVGGGDWSDLFNPDALLPSSDVYSPGAGTPGAITRTPKQPGQATILALVREFSSSPRPVSQRPPSGGVGRAIRITGPTTISMVDPAATNSLQSTSADALYSAATSARAASTKALAVLHGTVTTTASATLKANAADILLSGWRIPDKLPVRGIGLRPVKTVQMTFTPKTFTCDVTFHVG